MKKIIILDYSSEDGDNIHIFDYDENIYSEYEDFYIEINETQGFNFDDSSCNCMIVENLNIKIH